MSEYTKEFGVIGLGKMGGNLSRQALEKGHHVVGFDPYQAPEDLSDSGMVIISELKSFLSHLSSPRAIFLYIPAGSAVDDTLLDLADILEPGDIIVDGGNSYWGDSIRRADRLKARNIFFVDLGTSGGVGGARHGACFMAGGESKAVKRIEPILLDLATPNGYVHAGGSGAGHYTKLVHNGIEFGMMQAIGEGLDLLEHYPMETLHTSEIVECWRHGSVIRSWLVDILAEALRTTPDIKTVPSYVDDTGEVNWLVADALHLEVPIPVIAQSVMQLFTSRDDKKDWARAIAMMRHGFGGHAYGPSPAAVKVRHESRVGGFYQSPTPLVFDPLL